MLEFGVCCLVFIEPVLHDDYDQEELEAKMKTPFSSLDRRRWNGTVILEREAIGLNF